MSRCVGVVAAGALISVLSGCGSSRQVIDTNNLPDTYQCSYAKDACKEAEQFEGKFLSLPKEDQQEFKSVLTGYQLQCADALKACRSSDTTKQAK